MDGKLKSKIPLKSEFEGCFFPLNSPIFKKIVWKYNHK